MLFEGKMVVVFGIAMGRVAVMHHQKVAHAEVVVFGLPVHPIMFPKLRELAPLVGIEVGQ